MNCGVMGRLADAINNFRFCLNPLKGQPNCQSYAATWRIQTRVW